MLKTTDDAYIRVLEEKAFLESKVEKLDIFVRAARRGELKDSRLDHSDIELLEEQLHYMRGYLRILNARIARIDN